MHPLRANAQSEHINRKNGGIAERQGACRPPPKWQDAPVCRPESLIVVNAYNNDDWLVVLMQYRASNAFGALILDDVLAVVDIYTGEVLQVEE